jgi:L-fuconolactonase
MLKIDSHQHFWQYDRKRHDWITDDMAAIQRDFLPADLEPILAGHAVSGCVAVQVDQNEGENDFLLGLASKYSFIRGVVGWIDLKAQDVQEGLEYYSSIPLMKGFRHILHGEADEKYMLNRDFKRGIGLLSRYNFTYDILIKPNHLHYARDFVAAFPNQKFVIDHLAKPFIKAGIVDGWREDISALAAYPNVYCKISGMVTEANWTRWKAADFTPYLDTVFNAFGPSRIMFGSDWPVSNVAGGYSGVLQVVDPYVNRLTASEQELFWSGNAKYFYGL